MIRRRILFGIVFAVLFGIGWGVGRGRAGGDLYRNLDMFVEVLHAVQTSYVDPVEPRPLVEGGLHGLLRSLDPYSDYLTPHEMDAQRGSLEEDFEGVGVMLDLHGGAPVVVAPIEGSPAWEAGLMPGDVISKVDGHSTFGLGLPEIGARFRGEPGTTLTLTVYRVGQGVGDPKEYEVKRRRVEQRSVPYAFIAEPGIGYVRIAHFGASAAAELDAALDTLKAAGARAVVLDLRGNPGGFLEQAIGVVTPFVREGSLIVSTKGRASPEHKWVAQKSRASFAGPAAVLVDGASASAAEVVAGALQDLDRALVVGHATFGKGMVQEYYPLRNHEGALKLTTAYYYTASGRSLERSSPTGELEIDDGEDAADSAAVDSTPAPQVFHTAAGRVVHGGRVEPDIEVKPDSLPPLAQAVSSQRLAFRFAGGWAPAHGAAPDEAALAAFRADVVAKGVAVTDESWSASQDFLSGELRRELVRRSQGAAAAARVSLAADPDWQRAAAVLRRAGTAGEVFALAGVAKTAGAQAAPRPGGTPPVKGPTRKAR